MLHKSSKRHLQAPLYPPGGCCKTCAPMSQDFLQTVQQHLKKTKIKKKLSLSFLFISFDANLIPFVILKTIKAALIVQSNGGVVGGGSWSLREEDLR